jgi:hypothetical protein
MNLTRVNGTYARELLKHKDEIRKCSFNEYTSVASMRELVLEIIEPAYIDAEAKKRFISYLKSCETKKSIYWLCHNAIQKAMKYNQ